MKIMILRSLISDHVYSDHDLRSFPVQWSLILIYDHFLFCDLDLWLRSFYTWSVSTLELTPLLNDAVPPTQATAQSWNISSTNSTLMKANVPKRYRQKYYANSMLMLTKAGADPKVKLTVFHNTIFLHSSLTIPRLLVKSLTFP